MPLQLELTLYTESPKLSRFFQVAIQRIERGEFNKPDSVEHFEHVSVTALPQLGEKAYCVIGNNKTAYQSEVWVPRGVGGFQIQELQEGTPATCSALEAVAQEINARLS